MKKWLAKLWAKWFCKWLLQNGCDYWTHYAKSRLVRELPLKECVGWHCKGCPLRKG